ncbi:hypothetical protein [Acetilactobacillus jinshanensis]|uniref:Uncharacterized protein n=1 Tax=Acetilactobacillus jinshanensis TaxID=1720083 RepID=A0A4P6ZKW8_9LACO|nr:hypothetical protein [Acetilactobacillus jinshanensis]QBP18455.1 hypothetical protein ELX58_04745 [Acetilactobacillus jinshanensis]
MVEDNEQNIHEIRKRNKELLKQGIETNPSIAIIAEKAHYEPAELTDFDRKYVQKWLKKRIDRYNKRHIDHMDNK